MSIENLELTTEQIAKELGVALPTVFWWIRNGKLKVNRYGHRKVRIPYAEFLRFKNQRERLKA